MRTDDLIVALARNAGPVTPLAPPSLRFVRWLAAMGTIAAAGVFFLGPRADLARALGDAIYDARLTITLVSALLAAVAAFVLSVPGHAKSSAQRVGPFLAAAAWAVLLSVLLVQGGSPIQRVIAFPVNWPCGYKILGFSAIFGSALLTLLRRAAPLQPVWTSALAALAAATLAAAATQLICPVDDAAHQLVGHVLPVIGIALAGTGVGYGVVRRTAVLGSRF